MEENIIVIRDPKTFCSNFYWHKDNDENLKHKIEFIITKNRLKKFKETCFSSKFIYILHVEKYKTV